MAFKNIKSPEEYVAYLTKKKKLVENASTGVKMSEESARYVDSVLREAPKYDVKRKTYFESPEEIREDERSIVATITTDAVDLDNEIVLPAGVDISAYDQTKVIYANHDYNKPVGVCEWLRQVPHRWKAKGLFTKRPPAYPEGVEWYPDYMYEMVKAGVVKGTSIGFRPLEIREPTAEEKSAFPNVVQVISKSILLEWSVTGTPCNTEAVITEVKKADLSHLEEIVKAAKRYHKPKAKFYGPVAKALSRYAPDVDSLVKQVVEDLQNKYRT